MNSEMDRESASLLASNSCAHGLVFEDGSTLALIPHTQLASSLTLGEKSQGLPAPDPADGVITRFAEGFISENEMATETKFVVPPFPKAPTDDQKNKALAESKAKDPQGDQDRFLSTVTSNGYKLLVVRAREGQKDAKGEFVTRKDKDGQDVKVYDTTTGFIWLPSVNEGTVEQFVAWFANRYFGEITESSMQAAFTTFKKKAMDAELITLRSKLKAKKGTGRGRGGDIIF